MPADPNVAIACSRAERAPRPPVGYQRCGQRGRSSSDLAALDGQAFPRLVPRLSTMVFADPVCRDSRRLSRVTQLPAVHSVAMREIDRPIDLFDATSRLAPRLLYEGQPRSVATLAGRQTSFPLDGDRTWVPARHVRKRFKFRRCVTRFAGCVTHASCHNRPDSFMRAVWPLSGGIA
jgi:hypothetical protein